MRRGGLLAVAASVALLAALAPTGCIASFSGPYPCNPGYASCRGQGMGNNPGCETKIMDDPENCGACGSTCPFGAVCQNGTCGAPPTVLTNDANPGALGINSNALYYWSQMMGRLVRLPKDGSAASNVSLPNQITMGTSSPFAVDDTRVYYEGANTMPNPMGNQNVLASAPADGSGTMATTIATLPSNNMGQGTFGPGLLLHDGTLFLLEQVCGGGPCGLSIWSVPTSGGSLTQVGAVPQNVDPTNQASALAIDSSNFYFAANGSNTNGCTIDALPVAGGSPSPIVNTEGEGCANVLATDGKVVYFAGYYSRSDDNGNQHCIFGVYGVPVSGGNQSTIYEVESTETPGVMAVDGGNVYVVTTSSVWKIPTGGGGSPTRLAGGLNASIPNGGGMGGGPCYVGGNGNSQPMSIAVDASNVYVAVATNPPSMGGPGSGSGYALLKLPK